MKFKVGDKVKVTYNSSGSSIVRKAMNEVGVVFSTKHMIYIQFDKDIWQGLTLIGFFENEIEPAIRIGEQLLFSFMK